MFFSLVEETVVKFKFIHFRNFLGNESETTDLVSSFEKKRIYILYD